MFDPSGVASQPTDAAVDNGDGSVLPDASAPAPDAALIDATPPEDETLDLGDVRLLAHRLNALDVEVWRRDIQDATWRRDGMTAVLPGNARFLSNRVAPDGSRDEVFGALTDNGGQLVLSTQNSTAGGPWIPGWQRDVPGDARSRSFDIEYEASGEAMMVYSIGDDKPRYRTYVNGMWSDELTTPITSSGNIVWIELVPRPGTDELALASIDDNEDLWVGIWDGDAWDNASVELLFADVKPNPVNGVVQNPVVDMAYEAGGDLIVVWGDNLAQGFKLAVKPPGLAAGIPIAVAAPGGGRVHAIDAEARAGSDEIAFITSDLGDGTERLGAARWDGAVVRVEGEVDPQINNVNDLAYGDFPAAIAWIGDNPVAVYPDNQNATLDWAHFVGGNFAEGDDIAIAGKGRTESVLFQTLPDGNQAVGVLSGDGGELYVFSRVVDTWNIENAGQPLVDMLATSEGMAFSMDVRQQ